MMEQFVSKQLGLLELEKEAEIEATRKLYQDVPLKELERRGVCLQHLRVSSCATGFFDRTVVALEPFWPGKELAANKFAPGDIAGISLQKDQNVQLLTAVVTRSSAKIVEMATERTRDQLDFDDGAQYKLVKLANDVTYRRIKRALQDLERFHGNGRAGKLVSCLLGGCAPSSPSASPSPNMCFVNAALNDVQKEAVVFALEQPEVAILHGPPGTGKTTTLVEIILQAVKREQKVLVCAPSNIAVDNLVERLVDSSICAVRLGHPARTMASIQRSTLDARLARSDEGNLLRDIRTEIDQALNEGKKFSGQKSGQRGKCSYREVNALRKELRQREAKATAELLRRASVVLATLTSSYADGPLKHLEKEHFDLLVIDECSQACEAACWIPLLRVSKCILAGDHFQLPPTVISEKAASEGLGVSLMERLCQLYGAAVTKLLTVQYRMHSDIMMWSSAQFYEGKLIAHPSVAEHLLRDLPGVVDDDDTRIPLLVIDTAGCDLNELETSDEESKGNEGEAALVSCYVEALIQKGVLSRDIAVITPYNLQVELLRAHLRDKYNDLEIRSVDGFQGREKEAVVMSLVRSNAKGEVGFLSEHRRTNVAITRARRHVAVVCDSETVGRDAVLKAFLDYANACGEVRSAHQYLDAIDLSQRYQPPARSKTNVQQQERKKKDQPKHKPKKDIVAFQAEVIADSVASSQKRENAMPHFISEAVAAFAKDDASDSYTFPASLTSYERRLVHEVAEREQWQHESRGEGEERCVTLLKRKDAREKRSRGRDGPEEASPAAPAAIPTPAVEESRRETKPTHDDEKAAEEKEKKEKVARRPAKLPPPPPPRLPEEEEEKGASVDEEAEFEVLVAAERKRNEHCSWSRCKVSTRTIGPLCRFCRQVFCLSHSMPEIHGCGDLARREARRGPAPVTVPSGSSVVRRAQLQRQLGKKLAQLAHQRKPNTK